MLTLYYSPGACSLAPHIALEEVGASYTLQLVSIPNGEQQAPEYLNVNPRGKIPALSTDAGVLTENVAILTYIARLFPQAGLLPEEPLDMARCISHMAWLSNTVHPAFTHIVRPGRFATEETAHANLRATGRDNASKLLAELDALLAGREWVLGARYSVADPYTLVVYGWGKGHGMPVDQLANYTSFKDRMLQRRRCARYLSARRAGCSAADEIGRFNELCQSRECCGQAGPSSDHGRASDGFAPRDRNLVRGLARASLPVCRNA
jgi:glutathione S-transferase